MSVIPAVDRIIVNKRTDFDTQAKHWIPCSLSISLSLLEFAGVLALACLCSSAGGLIE
jgi:hypothetical protein